MVLPRCARQFALPVLPLVVGGEGLDGDTG
jgi:hypothetical protein